MKLAIVASMCLMMVSTAHAAYVPKGSWVGRLFRAPIDGTQSATTVNGRDYAAEAKAAREEKQSRETKRAPSESSDESASSTSSVARTHASGALRSFAIFADGPSALADDEDADSGDEKPISPENLAKLMKHPTVPNYDLLRPMSGVWGQCSPSTGEPGVQSFQVRFSSTDRTNFTRSAIRASDTECKKPVSEWRTSYQCSEAGKSELLCKMTKQETRNGSGPFTTDNLTKDQLKSGTMKLSFIGVTKPKKHKKVADKDRHLEIRMVPVSGGEPSVYKLDFLPDVASAAVSDAPVAAPAPRKKRATKD